MAIEKVTYPDTMEIYDMFVRPDDIPKDVPFDDLTPEQQQRIIDAYRFSGYRPGTYQGITGTKGMI
jgi:hypothetical protein